jgi:hypothetical protein
MSTKLTKIDGIELIAENEFSKTFKYIDEISEIDLFIAKAYDDEQNRHYVVASIPYIKETGSERVQFPFIFEDEEDMNNGFIGFDLFFVKKFIPELIGMIKKQNEEKLIKELEEKKVKELEEQKVKQLEEQKK